MPTCQQCAGWFPVQNRSFEQFLCPACYQDVLRHLAERARQIMDVRHCRVCGRTLTESSHVCSADCALTLRRIIADGRQLVQYGTRTDFLLWAREQGGWSEDEITPFDHPRVWEQDRTEAHRLFDDWAGRTETNPITPDVRVEEWPNVNICHICPAQNTDMCSAECEHRNQIFQRVGPVPPSGPTYPGGRPDDSRPTDEQAELLKAFEDLDKPDKDLWDHLKKE